ncbi:hypothetical protein Taro_003831 [Colocasia esculenta]|uniref:Retrotransposon gag domain-containing protein n=1 Tax=Colocasia esculenta TaxID=4460 RepID=A0A843TN86_COLES|nr:hypothetical protein [Colocasia esculenta]
MGGSYRDSDENGPIGTGTASSSTTSYRRGRTNGASFTTTRCGGTFCSTCTTATACEGSRGTNDLPIYTGGPNPDTEEHWIHEVERVFVTMRCPPAYRVVLAAYQLRGFAQEWWRLKMQTTFVGRTEEIITWSEFLEVFNDTFFLVQVHQAKREQFRTFQQGNSSVLEYQMRFMALSRYAPNVVSDNAMMVEYFIRGLRTELQNAVISLMCRIVEEAAQRAATLERSIRTW